MEECKCIEGFVGGVGKAAVWNHAPGVIKY